MNPPNDANYPANAVNISGSLDDQGHAKSDVTTQTAAITVNYDPANGTYVLTRADGAHHFGAADMTSAVLGQIDYAMFGKSIRNGTENLIVSLMPQKSVGKLNWVGNGLWLRQTASGDKNLVSGDAFDFGLPTLAGAIPHTGTATYAVYFLGTLSQQDSTPLVLRGGPGTLIANFADSSISVDGSVGAVDLLTANYAGAFSYSGTATIASDGFSGDFSLAGIDGTWNGQFFGPAAQEVGALLRSSAGTADYIGSLVGSSDSDFRQIQTNLVDMKYAATFDGYRLETYQHFDTDTGATINEGGSPWGFGIYVNYTPTDQQWSLANTFNFKNTDFNSAQSDSSYEIYGDVTADDNGVDGLSILKPGPDNPIIQLTYTTIGIWELSEGPDQIMRNFVVFGLPTGADDVPLSGTGNYSGIISGVGASMGGASDVFYSLDGTVALSADFGAGTWGGTINPTGTDRNGGPSRDFGTFDIAPGLIGGAELQSTGLDFGSTANVGNIEGHFFGPQAAEVGGDFSTDFADPVRAGSALTLTGVYVGKR